MVPFPPEPPARSAPRGPDEPHPADSPPPGDATDFLQELVLDREAGRHLPLAHYLARWPGREEELARLYLEVVTPEADADEPGRLGRYRLLEELGRGGQGIVYRAEDTRLGRAVALKVLHPGLVRADEALLRLRREAELLSKLDHPGICPVYDRGREDGRDFLAMKLLRGSGLDELLHRGGPPTDRAAVLERARLIEEVARALHAAHVAGILHRDVKPKNVIVGEDGPVLLDFGLGRDADSGALTRSGDVFGTPDYMAPESFAATREPDVRVDVWGLGATLFHALTGSPPFARPTAQATMLAIQRDPAPSARSANRAVPRELAVVCATALESDVDRRYQSALDLAEDLRRIREHEPIRARPAGPWLRARRWARRHPTLSVGGGLAAAALAVVSTLEWNRMSLAAEKAEAVSLMTSVADHELGELLLQEVEDTLWPVGPALVPACERWLAREQDLQERRGLHAELRTGLRERRDPTGAFLDDRERLSDERLTRHLERLDELAARRSAVEQRLESSASLAQRSVLDHADAWDAAIEAIGASPRYGGLRLAPQVGLVPLGESPQGLWEFWLVESGDRPPGAPGDARAADGAGLVLVLIPGGTTRIGARDDDAFAQANQVPLQTAELEPYFIGKFELTQGQWSAAADAANPAAYPPDHPHRVGISAAASPWELPVENVGWDEARRVLARLGLALPTEAQWEHAARGGTETAFSSGPDAASGERVGNFQGKEGNEALNSGFLVEHYSDGHVVSAPVGSFPPNPFGLHDVHGNVWEWTADPYGRYGETPLRAGDGLREVEEDRGIRALRGGTFSYPAQYGTSAIRNQVRSDVTAPDVGLRPVRRIDR